MKSTSADDKLLAEAKLILHVQYPDLEEVWLEGYHEGMSQLDEMVNPYPNGSEEHQFWHEGWWAACFEEPPLFNLDGSIVESRAESAEIIPLPLRPEAKVKVCTAVNDDSVKTPKWMRVLKISAVCLATAAAGATLMELAG